MYIYIYIYTYAIYIYIYMNMFFGTVEVFGCSVWRKFGTFFFGWTKNESIFSEINCIFRLFFLVHSIFLGHWYPMFKYVGCYPASNNAASWAGYSDHKSDPGRPRGWPSARRSKVRSWDLGLSWHILAHLVTIWIYLIFLWKIWNR